MQQISWLGLPSVFVSTVVLWYRKSRSRLFLLSMDNCSNCFLFSRPPLVVAVKSTVFVMFYFRRENFIQNFSSSSREIDPFLATVDSRLNPGGFLIPSCSLLFNFVVGG